MEPVVPAEQAIMTAFGDFLRRRRWTTEQTLENVAAKCNMKIPTLSRWERGQVSTRIGPKTLRALASALDVSFEIMQFRYQRSRELAQQADLQCVWFPVYCGVQVEVDKALLQNNLCPATEEERAEYARVEGALKESLKEYIEWMGSRRKG